MSQYDDLEWMKWYRTVIREKLEAHQKGEITGSSYELAQQHFPNDLERQTDMCMWVGESLGRAEELGYEAGMAPTDLVRQIANKYDMVKIMDLETLLFRSDGDTAILDKEVQI